MLLQIMAQSGVYICSKFVNLYLKICFSGCFVPAEQAVFRAADKLFARISNNDDMESNASSFTLEVSEKCLNIIEI